MTARKAKLCRALRSIRSPTLSMAHRPLLRPRPRFPTAEFGADRRSEFVSLSSVTDVRGRCGTKDYVLLVPQSRQRINSGRSPGRRIAGENRGTYQDDAGQRQGSRIIGLGVEQKRFDQPGPD